MTWPLVKKSVALVGASIWHADNQWIVKANRPEVGANHEPSGYWHVCASVEPLPCPQHACKRSGAVIRKFLKCRVFPPGCNFLPVPFYTCKRSIDWLSSALGYYSWLDLNDFLICFLQMRQSPDCLNRPAQPGICQVSQQVADIL